VLDTGSSLTVLNERACKQLGIEKAEEAGDADLGVKIVGVDGSESLLCRLNEVASVQFFSDNAMTGVSLGRSHVPTGWNRIDTSTRWQGGR
jgi:hypothetical protein